MNAVLSKLKFVAAKRLVDTTDPTQFRRQKMLKKLDEQIAMAQAMAEGRSYAVSSVKRVRDEMGPLLLYTSDVADQ